MSDPPGAARRPPVPPELRRGYLTEDVAPVPGEVRAAPEDFEVEELPLYEPSGEGEHLYLWIEKRGIATDEAVRRIARRLVAKPSEVGYAGLKDAQALTRQWISVFRARAEDAPRVEDEQLRVLVARPHRNKLKVGHLRGNRFAIRIRGGGPAVDDARAALGRLAAGGVANYVGLQRFGSDRTTHLLGRALVAEDPQAFLDLLLLGAPRDGAAPEALPGRGRVLDARRAALERDWERAARALPPSYTAELAACRALARGAAPEVAARAVAPKRRGFFVAAFQSLLFNAYLTRRLDRIARLEAGEVAFLHRNGAAFLVADEAAEQARCAAGEISPSGPLFGKRLLRPASGSSAYADEQAVLAEHAPGLGPELTPALGARPAGQRRALRILLEDVDVIREGEDLRVRFALPKGCYATSVLEELFKRQTD